MKLFLEEEEISETLAKKLFGEKFDEFLASARELSDDNGMDKVPFTTKEGKLVFEFEENEEEKPKPEEKKVQLEIDEDLDLEKEVENAGEFIEVSEEDEKRIEQLMAEYAEAQDNYRDGLTTDDFSGFNLVNKAERKAKPIIAELNKMGVHLFAVDKETGERRELKPEGLDDDIFPSIWTGEKLDSNIEKEELVKKEDYNWKTVTSGKALKEDLSEEEIEEIVEDNTVEQIIDDYRTEGIQIYKMSEFDKCFEDYKPWDLVCGMNWGDFDSSDDIFELDGDNVISYRDEDWVKERIIKGESLK